MGSPKSDGFTRIIHTAVSINGATPIAESFFSWKIHENPMKVDDPGGPSFMETPIRLKWVLMEISTEIGDESIHLWNHLLRKHQKKI